MLGDAEVEMRTRARNSDRGRKNVIKAAELLESAQKLVELADAEFGEYLIAQSDPRP